MATASDYATPPPAAFSRSSSLSVARSPDTASPIYPDRAIRPLPKSRLKARLSPDQASSIVYPPSPPPISPALTFGAHDGAGHYAGPAGGRMTNGDAAHGHYLHHHSHHDSPVHDHCTCGEDGDSGDEEVEFDHPDYRYAAPPMGTEGSVIGGMDAAQRRLMSAARVPAKPPPPGSTASSADGYESLENTSNKKKRKIPLSNTSSMHQSQLSAEMASMGISGALDGAADDVHRRGGTAVAVPHPYAPASVSSGTGISGAGRGRYGRHNVHPGHGIRRPLASSSVNAINAYGPRLSARSGGDVKGVADAGIENTGGIISQAIKSAAEQGPLTPQKGQENASLLQSATATSSNPANAKTQFTFAVESESASRLVDQQAAAASAAAQAAYATPTPAARGPNGQPIYPPSKGQSTQGTQTNLPLRPGTMPANATRQPPGAPQPAPVQGQQPAAQQGRPPSPRPKPRRRPSKEYAKAAKQRRIQQQYTNYHHRPNKDNMYICEFCEYEDIFGVPPVALIRQYEIKDRAERKRAAEKRRLLEKAKAKNRKGKKGSKKGNSGANNSAASGSGAQGAHHAGGAAGGQDYDPHALPPDGEEYYDDEEYGDEYDPVGPDEQYPAEYYPPPPAPAGTPQPVAAGMGGAVGAGPEGGGGGKHGG